MPWTPPQWTKRHFAQRRSSAPAQDCCPSRKALRDPTPADWLTEPIEALSKLSIPHLLSYENWFDVAIARKEYEHALEAADIIAEHSLVVAEAPPEKPRRGTDYDRVVEWAVIQIKRSGLRCTRCNGVTFAGCIAYLNRGAIVCDGCAARAGINTSYRRDG